MTKIVRNENYFQRNYFRVKIVKGILFGVGTHYISYLGLGNRTEKYQLTHFLRYAALSR